MPKNANSPVYANMDEAILHNVYHTTKMQKLIDDQTTRCADIATALATLINYKYQFNIGTIGADTFKTLDAVEATIKWAVVDFCGVNGKSAWDSLNREAYGEAYKAGDRSRKMHIETMLDNAMFILMRKKA